MRPYEDIRQVLTHRKLGREEALQLVLTALVVGGVYPPWGTRSRPTDRGAEFLRRLHVLVFGVEPASPCEVFVDEFELPRRHQHERAGWPDWAVLWDDRLWIIELKTEAGSHRPDQLPHYLDLAAHHHLAKTIDLTYLTGPLDKPAPPLGPGQRYHHVTWNDVIPIVEAVWADDDPAARAYVDAARDLTTSIGSPWPEWRSGWLAADAISGDSDGEAVTEEETVGVDGTDLWSLIAATAQDGTQRALDVTTGSGESLEDLRNRARELIVAAEASPTKHVLPWIWSRQTSGGLALTSAGEELGAELRFSRYEKARF